MLRHLIVLVAAICCVRVGAARSLQSVGPSNVRERVLDVLFPSDVASAPYVLKLMMRFGDTRTQIVVFWYAPFQTHEDECEFIRYSLSDATVADLERLVSTAIKTGHPQPQEIAAQVKATMIRSFAPCGGLKPALDELRSIKVSPALRNRAVLDTAARYEFVYDTWEDSVHYSFWGASSPDAPQDTVLRWMLKFRSNLPKILGAKQ